MMSMLNYKVNIVDRINLTILSVTENL